MLIIKAASSCLQLNHTQHFWSAQTLRVSCRLSRFLLPPRSLLETLPVTLLTFSSHGNVPQTNELCSFILNLAPLQIAVTVGNAAYFPPLCSGSSEDPACSRLLNCLIVTQRDTSSVWRVGVLPLSVPPSLFSLRRTRP